MQQKLLSFRDELSEVLSFNGSQKIELEGLELRFCLRDNAEPFFNGTTVPPVLRKISAYIAHFRELDRLGLSNVNILPSGHTHMQYPGINITYDAFLAYEAKELEYIIFSISENNTFKDLLMDGRDPVRDRQLFVSALLKISTMFDLSLMEDLH